MANSTLKIQGMTCAACATRIEKGLSNMPGVKLANVNLAMERAKIEFDETKVSLRDLEQKIEDIGYKTIKDKVELDIQGMTCAACAARIEKGLGKLQGVSGVNVNLVLERATIDYNVSELDVKDLIKQVEEIGYKAKERRETNVDAEKEAREADIKNQKRKLIISAILSFPLLISTYLLFL